MVDNITITVPYMHGMSDWIRNDPRITFFDGVAIPETQGGREPFFVKNTLPSVAEVLERIVYLKSRYKVLMTSTSPRWSEEAREIFCWAEKAGSPIVVTDMQFAQEIKEQYPKVELHSSSIAGLIYKMDFLMSQPYLNKVGLPNLWHQSPEDIIANTKEEWRSRLIAIVIKYCPWTSECLEHYNRISQLYNEGDVDTKIECFNKAPRPVGKPVTAGPLYKMGFRNFKLAGRIALGIDYNRGVQIIEDRIKQCIKEIEDVKNK